MESSNRHVSIFIPFNKLLNRQIFCSHTHTHTLVRLFSNKIEQQNAIGFLSMCHKLRDLDLTHNAITRRPDYRLELTHTLPALLILDGFACDVTPDQHTASDASSSLSSEWSKEMSAPLRSLSRSSQSVSDASAKLQQRPSTAGTFFHSLDVLFSSMCNGLELFLRPFHICSICNWFVDCDSAWFLFFIELTSSCSYGEPVVGNIVNRVRRRKQSGPDQPTKSLDRLATSLAIAGSCTSQSLHGLDYDSIASTSNAAATEPTQTSGFQQDASKLIEMCRKWRELSRKRCGTTEPSKT